jgi:hypothetical protein
VTGLPHGGSRVVIDDSTFFLDLGALAAIVPYQGTLKVSAPTRVVMHCNNDAIGNAGPAGVFDITMTATRLFAA